MKLSACVVSVVLCLNLVCSASDQKVDFSGTWILDVKNSDPFPQLVTGLGRSGFDMSGGEIGSDTSGRGGGTLSSRDGTGGMRGGGSAGMSAGRGFRPPDENQSLMIQQRDMEFEISRITQISGKDTPVLDKYKSDGKEVLSAMQTQNFGEVKVSTKATLKNNKLVVRTIGFFPQDKNELTREFLLSKDGKTLTLKTTNVSARGQFIQKQVYRRQ